MSFFVSVPCFHSRIRFGSLELVRDHDSIVAILCGMKNACLLECLVDRLNDCFMCVFLASSSFQSNSFAIRRFFVAFGSMCMLLIVEGNFFSL